MELLEVYQSLLKEVGFTDEIKEDTDVKALVTTFKEKQTELLKNNMGGVIEDAKNTAKKEAAIVTEKRIKKIFNKEYGIGLTDSEINDISPEDLAIKGKEKMKDGVSKDVTELQQKLIDLANEKTSEIDKLKAEKEQDKKEFEAREKARARDKVLSTKFNEKEYIGKKESLFDYFKKSLLADGYDIQTDENDNVVKIMKGEYEALKPDNSGKETLDSLHERYMNEFIKKSNGAEGTERTGAAGTDLQLDKLPTAMQQRIKEMKEKEQKQLA